MVNYFLSYSGNKDKDYAPLHAELAKYKGICLFDSVWCFQGKSGRADSFGNHFRLFVDKTDGLVVCEIVDWAAINIREIPENL